MEIRQPTEKEMIEGIAFGFKEFLMERNKVFGSDLSNHKIWEAIKIGVRDAFSGEDISKYPGKADKIKSFMEYTDYNKIIKGYRYKVPDDVLEEIKGIAANFHFRNGFKNDDGSVGSIRITYNEFLDCLAHTFSSG